MQRLRSTFKRSRTPTGAEMKSQSSLEVPKQVRSASFDEIQLEAQRQESQASAELRSIATMAMATTSSSLNAGAAANNTTTSSSSSSYSPSRSQTTDYTSSGAVRKHHLTNLRIPQLQTTQRSKSFDVAERTTSLLDRSASTTCTTMTGNSRWRTGTTERDNNPPAGPAAYSCWHCACVDEYRTSLGSTSNDSWEDEEDNDADDDDDEGGEEEYESGGELARMNQLSVEPEQPPVVQLERDSENSYYFVVVQKAYSEDIEDEGSDCSRREGSPEIRVTLTTTSDRTSTDVEPDSSETSDGRCELLPENRQRRRSLSRQEALPELPAILGISVSDDGAGGSSPDEDEDDDDNDDSDQACGGGGGGSKAGQLVVRDIFLTVPDLRRDRAASVDSCFNNNKNGKIETCYSLQVPQQSARSKSVDIVLPTDMQTRYTALLPGNEEARSFTG